METTLPDPVRGAPKRALALLVIAGLVFVAYYVILQKGYPTFWNDTYEYAQAARNLADGKGLKTSAASVLEVGFLGDAGLPPPYLLHDPGNSLIMAAFFRALGARASVIGVMGGTFFALMAPVTFGLGRTLFPEPVAFLAGLMVAVNSQLLVFAGAGYSEVPAAFLLTLLLWSLLTADRPIKLLVSGFIFGLLVLLRANGLPFLPGLLAFLLIDPRPSGRLRDRARRLTLAFSAFLLGMACVLGPSCVRNYRATGHPFYEATSSYSLVFHTAAIPKMSAVYDQGRYDFDPTSYALAHPGEIASKAVWQLSRETQHLLRGGVSSSEFASSVLVFLFLLALLAPPGDESLEQRRFRWLAGALVATALVVGSVFHLRWRHLYVFLPVMVLFAANLLTRLAGSRPAARRRFLAATLLLLAAFGAGFVAESAGQEGAALRERDRFYRELAGFLRKQTSPDAVVLLEGAGGPFFPVSNALAWYSERLFLQYDGYSLTSPAIRGTARPVYGLLVREGDAAPARPPQITNNRGFVPVATWTGPGGNAILFR
jgi:hypothetical protein